MQKDLEQQLYDKYEFMRTDEGSIPIHCGNGWFSLIKAFCDELREYCKANNIGTRDLEITQIKQKMGIMHMLYSSSNKAINDYLFGLTSKYENLSSAICEQCGSEGNLQILNSYRQVLCDNCTKAKPI